MKIRELKPSDSKKKAMARADKYFSLYIRLLYANGQGLVRCWTCGAWKHWKRIDCGHFRKRGKQTTRYREKNCGPQCRRCNRFEGGRDYRFGQMIDQIHGPGTAEKMDQLSRVHTQRKRYDFDYIAQEYYEKYKKLKQEKGL